MKARPIVIVSNRGPVSFALDGDQLVARRGAGGLVSGIAPLVRDTDVIWIAAAMSEGDRRAAELGVVEAEGFRVDLLALDLPVYRQYYDVISNGTLWFMHHSLWDLPRRPRFDARWHEAWGAFRAANEQFAIAIEASAPRDAVVLLQDLHLSLVASLLLDRRPDLRCVHFSHTPFTAPDGMRVLPDSAAVELLDGLAANAACGFHCERWRASFEQTCIGFGVDAPPSFVAPLGPDPDDIAATASSTACADELADIERTIGDRSLIARVDRVELSKNLLRGFHAFDALLTDRPDLRERVVFGAFVYPSREGLPEYLAYRQEVEGLVRSLNAKWATDGWSPILLDLSDNYPRSVAALRRSDVLLVNPIRDGLNLVAKEGPLVNQRDGVVVLSREAGAWPELADGVIGINPFDVTATADALAKAIDMPAAEREEQATLLRSLARARNPRTWLDDLLAAAG